VERGGPQMAIWRMRITCWIPKATDTHSEYVTYSLFFHCNNGCKNAPHCNVYTYIACLVDLVVIIRVVGFKLAMFFKSDECGSLRCMSCEVKIRYRTYVAQQIFTDVSACTYNRKILQICNVAK